MVLVGIKMAKFIICKFQENYHIILVRERAFWGYHRCDFYSYEIPEGGDRVVS